MAFDKVELRSREQILGDLVRPILARTDLSDIAPGSSVAILLEAIASSDYRISVSSLKILENSNLESLKGAALDKKAESIRLPNTVGGFGRIPANQASGLISIGSDFEEISSKLYAGKPAPFAGSTNLFLEDASDMPPTGNIYIGRGTVTRFEGPISYSQVVDNGSFWTMVLATPLTKNHILSDVVVLAQGGNRSIPAGTAVVVPATSDSPSIVFTTNQTVVIPDGEVGTDVRATCTQFGEIGNVLAGQIRAFSTLPFGGAVATNPTTFTNGNSTEDDERLRRRIKNYPATLSRGTRTAILAAIQGLSDPVTGRTITSSIAIDPTEPGDSSKVYIDDGTGLEPSFGSQAYELLLQSSSGQETRFQTAQAPVTAATIIGAEFGPFEIQQGQSIIVNADGISETYTITPSNYTNLNSATAYEIVRDFNAQSNLVGFRTISSGRRIVMMDLSGNIEELSVGISSLQAILGLPLAIVRPIFAYQDGVVQSFRGKTATLSTNPFPWQLNASQLENVIIVVDGVEQTISITQSDFSPFNTTISTATLTQWASVFRKKIAGVKFVVSGNVLVWSTFQQFSPSGTLEIMPEREDGSPAGWVNPSGMWSPVSAGGILSSVGADRDFKFNRFTGELEFVRKPESGTKIEVGSRTTRAELSSLSTPTGNFTLTQLPASTGTSKIIVGFDGDFATRSVLTEVGAVFTPTRPDAVAATNIIRLTANAAGLFENAQVGDYLYLAKNNSFVPGWGASIEGIYRLKSVGLNGSAVNVLYELLIADTIAGSDQVIVNHPNHGFESGALVDITNAGSIGGLTPAELSQSGAQITVINSSQYRYTAGASAASSDQGLLDQLLYLADAWVEIEISQTQDVDWTTIENLAQSMAPGMVNIFKSTVIPQLVDFGFVGEVDVDGVVEIINSQISSGAAVKRNPQALAIRSNDYLDGTCAILVVVGNAINLVEIGISSSIQSHVAFSHTGYTKSSFPIVQDVFSPASASNGLAHRYYMHVDKDLTNVTDVAANPTIESYAVPPGTPAYPVGFEHMWLTGRQAGLTGRVYNNQTSAPYTGIFRGEGAIRPLQTSDTIQTDPESLDRYSNFGIRFDDLAITARDRLVVELDLDSIDKTVAIPMSKRALIQDIDAISGEGRGQVISFRLKDPEDLVAGQPRPFFNAESVYRTFDFRDFKILTKSVGVYRDFDSFTGFPSGNLTAVREDQLTGIVDGDTFTLNDGVNPAEVFEFDSDAIVTPGNNPIPFIEGVGASGTLTAISADPIVGVQDGDTFTLEDGVNPPLTFEFDWDGIFTVGSIQVPIIQAESSTGSLTTSPADPVTGIAEGDTFTLDDGVNPAVTFEFDTDSSVSPGNVAVDLPSVNATSTQVKTASIIAINGASIDITAVSGPGNEIGLTNDTPGSQGNTLIVESFVNGVSLFPFGMTGGVDASTAAQVRTATISAINGAPLDISAAPGAGDDIDLTNQNTGTQGNIAITESIANSTLSPIGMSGGIDGTTAIAMKNLMVSAINTALFDINALAGSGGLVMLFNSNSGTAGNIPIVESLANTTLSPFGMSGGSVVSLNDRALVFRSSAFGSPSRMRLSIRYAAFPSESDIIVSHLNTYRGEPRTMILVTLPSSGLIAGSTLNSGNYNVSIMPYGTIFKMVITSPGINTGGEYLPGNILNISGVSPLNGSYYILSASVGSVTILAPGDAGVSNGQQFSGVLAPITSFEVESATWQDIADAINEYFPENPVATAEAIGVDVETFDVKEASYITYPADTPMPGVVMSEAFQHHSFSAKLSGNAGVFEYDSSDPSLNGIQATVQSDDAIYPTIGDVSGTTYSPIDEEVAIVPTNSKSLEAWMNFNAVSSLNILARIDQIQSSERIQISSRVDGSAGAVRVTGVTANRIESEVRSNASVSGDAMNISILASDARALKRGGLVRIDNSIAAEIFRPYRSLPVGASETAYNTVDINTFFRQTNSVKYNRLTASTARVVFYRFGTGIGQSESLSIGDTITLTSLSDGNVQVSSSGGDLTARTGDMMYIKPGAPFPADVTCKGLPGATGITLRDAPEYLGYPVVHVIDETNVVVKAPNITSFGPVVLASDTDLVFLPAIYNEKNVRTNKKEGAKFTEEFGNGEMFYLIKKLGGNMVLLIAQNSPNEDTDTMLLSESLVNTDDWINISDGFSVVNHGTFKIVAHNGRNQIIYYNPEGGADEILDNTTLSGGGIGQRKWRVGPLNNSASRPLRILDAESVRAEDRLRISTPLTGGQWFPNTMIGSFRILGLGFVGIVQATGELTAVSADPVTGIANGDSFTLNDGLIGRLFEFDTTGSVSSGAVRVAIGPTDSPTSVKTAIINAINSLGTTFFVSAESGPGDTIILRNRRLSLNSNQAVTETFANALVTLSPIGMAGAVVDDGQIQPYVDIEVSNAPVELVASSTGLPIDKFQLAGNSSSIGFVERDPFFGFRMVAGHGVNPIDNELSNVFILPRNSSGKIAQTFGTKISALFKTGFPERTFQGIDGYKIFTGLVREAHRVIDGRSANTILFPGVKAMGTVVEVLPPLIRSIQIDLRVAPKDGVTLNTISEIVRSTVAGYINNLGVGQPVVTSEIIRIIQSLPGVFSSTIVATRPAPLDDRIVVSDIEKAFVLDATRDINIG